MMKTLPYIVCCMFLFAGPGLVHAQETPTIKTAVDKNQILIGEPIRYTIDIQSPMVSGNQLPSFDSIPHFEMIEKGNRDSLISANGASYHLEWKITSFDSGTRTIPSFPVVIGNKVIKTDSLAIEISYGKVDTAKDYHDIKSIIDVENPDVKYIPWILGALSLVALFLFIWFSRKPFVTVPVWNEEPVPRIRALDEALAKLDQLKLMLHNDPSSVKKYYTGMHDCLRIFLNHELGMVTMEKTSEELILSLSDLQMDGEKFSKLFSALRMGDFVKFAKYIPGPFENDNNLEVIRAAIVFIDENRTPGYRQPK
jgi:hypothetical protein